MFFEAPATLNQYPHMDGPDVAGYGHGLLAQEALSRLYALPIGASRPGAPPMRLFLALASPNQGLRGYFAAGLSLPIHIVKGAILAFFPQWAVVTYRGGSADHAGAPAALAEHCFAAALAGSRVHAVHAVDEPTYVHVMYM